MNTFIAHISFVILFLHFITVANAPFPRNSKKSNSDVHYGSNSNYAVNFFSILFDYLSFFGLFDNSRSESILEKIEKLFVLIIYIYNIICFI